jgi:hypothetical protein
MSRRVRAPHTDAAVGDSEARSGGRALTRTILPIDFPRADGQATSYLVRCSRKDLHALRAEAFADLDVRVSRAEEPISDCSSVLFARDAVVNAAI